MSSVGEPGKHLTWTKCLGSVPHKKRYSNNVGDNSIMYYSRNSLLVPLMLYDMHVHDIVYCTHSSTCYMYVVYVHDIVKSMYNTIIIILHV